MVQASPRRAVRSYVIREGRMTRGQIRALTELLPRYALDTRDILFARDHLPAGAPLWLEIGIGNGDNLVAMAAAAPDTRFIGCEVHRPGIGHALLGIERLQLENVRVACLDALDVLASLPDHSVSGICIFFPDPWPKKRHHKRRLFNAGLLQMLARVSRPEARLRFTSDDADYAMAARALIRQSRQWINLAGDNAWAPRSDCRIETRFEARAHRAGRDVYELLASPAG